MLTKYTLKRLREFLDGQCGKVAVYGMKLNAQFVYWNFSDYIACFLDKEVDSGYFCGIEILRLEDLPKHNIGAVVIAASLSAEPHIYKRIHMFCEKYGIALYGLYSGKLNSGCLGRELFADTNQEKKLRKAIVEHDVITFDIFDTLLMRRVLYPTDVFDIVEHRLRRRGLDVPGFKNYRIQAERGDSPHKGLDGIYQVLREILGWTETQSELAMHEELEVERQAILQRSGMAELLSYARNNGKKVLLVSDMYLSSKFLREILSEHGLTEYDELYVSDERGTGKGEELFALVRNDYPAESYLHIGDNTVLDGWSARVHGFDTWLLPSALQMIKGTKIAEILPLVENLNDRLLVGSFAAQAFRSPFAARNVGLSVTSVPQFASLFLAPVAAQYVIWLLQRAKVHKFDAILFAARDGWLFSKIYEEAVKIMKLYNVPQGVYFYGSRKLCISAAMQDENALQWMKGLLSGQMHHFLRENFDFVAKDRHIPPADGENPDMVWDELVEQKEKIFAHSAVVIKGYEQYIVNLGLKKEGRYAFADLCSQGTTQCALTHSVLPNLYGLFFARYMSGSSITMGRLETFLPQADWHMLANNVFEFIFSSPEPSAASVDTDGKIIFEIEDRSENELEILQEAQEEITGFCREFFLLCDPECSVSPAVGQLLLSMYQQPVFVGATSVFDGLDINDNLMGVRVDCLLTDEK